ncbi:MAG: class I SAM-dependent methyltransferase [Novosphingobium sp.]|nr:class I SAM-dependent methyltransferase [Novosphingobium sp.]
MRPLIAFFTAMLGIVAPPALATESGRAVEMCEGCETLLEAAIAHPRRSADRPRDVWRHPVETLAFFRVRPGMTVIDYMPSGGWYTRVLVPYLGKDGHYIGLNPAIGAGAPQGLVTYFGGLKEKFPAEAAKWNLEGAPVEAYNTDQLGQDRNGTVDRVLIFREIHNLFRRDFLRPELARLHQLLKDDGLLGVVQHRARADAPAAYTDGNKGYMRQKDVIALFEVNGFELVDQSEINANPKDTADHPEGVWELPPVQRTKRDDLAAIGESDRMTLLFRKRP